MLINKRTCAQVLTMIPELTEDQVQLIAEIIRPAIDAQCRGCRRKRIYATKAQARSAPGSGGQCIYKCPVCKLWHRTTKK